MYMTETDERIPIRKARATLRKLTEAKAPVILLNFLQPCAILVPLPHDRYLRPGQKAAVRGHLRTQFGRLLSQALPKGR